MPLKSRALVSLLVMQSLEAAGSKLSWRHITDQIGMFAFTGMTPEQVDKLYERSIYLTRNGRISMAGVNTKNVERLAQAIHEVRASGPVPVFLPNKTPYDPFRPSLLLQVTK